MELEIEKNVSVVARWSHASPRLNAQLRSDIAPAEQTVLNACDFDVEASIEVNARLGKSIFPPQGLCWNRPKLRHEIVSSLFEKKELIQDSLKEPICSSSVRSAEPYPKPS